MDVFPVTQLLHGGLSTRLPCKSMEQMHCPGATVHFFVSWGLFHDRFRLFKFADSKSAESLFWFDSADSFLFLDGSVF